MQNGLYVSLSAQVALERRLETIADNVANMNTVGYRATGVSFETEVAKAGDARLGYASSGSDFISRRLGGLTKTDNSLDFAVQGDGEDLLAADRWSAPFLLELLGAESGERAGGQNHRVQVGHGCQLVAQCNQNGHLLEHPETVAAKC